MYVGVAGRQVQRGLKLDDGLVEPRRPDQRETQVVVGVGVIGMDGQSFFVLDDRFFWLLFRQEGVAQVAVRLGVVGVDGQGALVLGDCLVGALAKRALPRLKSWA